MARGSAVVEYHGARGTVYRIKFVDARGKQVMETLGSQKDGWTHRRALLALGARVSDVEKTGWRKPERVTFDDFAARFVTEYLPGRRLKRSTLIDYHGAIGLPDPEKGTDARHLSAFFGPFELAAIEPADVDQYIATKTETLAAKTINNHLSLLHEMFKVAKRWRLVQANPVEDVDLPRVEQREMSVLSEAEIAGLLAAYRELESSPPNGTALEWWRQTRRIVTVALGTGLRRGELLALRWSDVRMLDGLVSVREAYVRGEFQSPKSRKSRRTFELGPVVLAALREQWQETPYKGDTDLVFSHPDLGTPLDPSKLSRQYMRPALAKAGIAKPFRVWHDLRHTALTHEAAAGNPAVYVQWKAGHSQGSITERYLHAAQVLFPGAAARGEARLFAAVEEPAG
jgi:integrase